MKEKCNILTFVLRMCIGGHGKLSKDPGQEGAIRKVANEAEILFYQTLNGDDPQLETIPEHIRSFFPRFYGVSDKSTWMPWKACRLAFLFHTRFSAFLPHLCYHT